jgi:hypothetical protein
MGPGQVMMTIFGVILAVPAFVGVSTLLFSQTQVILQNHTMLERLGARKLKELAKKLNDNEWRLIRPYDVGKFKNFVSVFGSSPWQWLLPIRINNKKDHEIKEWLVNKNYVAPGTNQNV